MAEVLIVREAAQETAKIAQQLLRWYDKNQRLLPWRKPSHRFLKEQKPESNTAFPLPYDIGTPPNTYHVWLSEIMLQQTTVVTVKPYFLKFVSLWPTIQELAQSPLDDVLVAWAGLGYYARARNMHKAANMIVDVYSGVFPKDIKALKKLPGIGDYTAAAIASIAFDEPKTAVDGNVKRVMARLFNIETPLPKGLREIEEKAQDCTPLKNSGDYIQALMDLGTLVCKPKKPDCPCCPLENLCLGKKNAHFLPRKALKKKRMTRHGVVFWIMDRQEANVIYQKRPPKGLLGGMAVFPMTSLETYQPDKTRMQLEQSVIDLLLEGQQRQTKDIGIPKVCFKKIHNKEVVHVFTHFRLELTVVEFTLESAIEDFLFCPIGKLKQIALPSVMWKVKKRCLGD